MNMQKQAERRLVVATGSKTYVFPPSHSIPAFSGPPVNFQPIFPRSRVHDMGQSNDDVVRHAPGVQRSLRVERCYQAH